MRSRLSERRERFGNAVTHLEAVSPLATLARGYSVTSVRDGTVLETVKQVKTGDPHTTRLKDGWVESEVKPRVSFPSVPALQRQKTADAVPFSPAVTSVIWST